jgi:hypothetical protein
MRCVNCGYALQDGEPHCPQCGGATGWVPPSPPPPPPESAAPPPSESAASPLPGPVWGTAIRSDRRRLRVPALVTGLILVVVVAAAGITLVATRHGAAGPSSTAAALPVSSTAGSAPLSPSSPQSPPSSPSADFGSQQPDDATAKSDLDNEVNQDRGAAEALVENWVPQLSSKRPGLVVDGVTYDYPHIWADFQQLRQQYPSALLLWSGDYTSFKSPDFYITVVAQPYPDGRSANGWCDAAGLGPDDCYAKLLSHVDGPANATLLRS